MTAAFLLMSSAALAGADTAPPAAPAPVVVHSGAGCNNCAPPATPCGCESKKIGLLDKLKAKFGKKSSDCGCAPVPACAPVPPPAPCNTCSPCGSVASRPNLLDKLKSRCGHKKADACGPVCDPCGAAHLTGGCATPGAPYVAPGTGGTTPPKEMPKPKDEKPKSDEKPKGGTSSSIPVPLPPVNGAGGLTGSGSPY